MGMRISLDLDMVQAKKKWIRIPVENINGEVVGILWKLELPTLSWEHPAGFTVPAGWGAQTPGCEGVWVEIDGELPRLGE